MANQFSLISTLNAIDSLGSILSISAHTGSATDVLPLSNLQKRGLAEVWRRGPLNPGDTFTLRVFIGANTITDFVAMLDFRVLDSTLSNSSSHEPPSPFDLPTIQMKAQRLDHTLVVNKSFDLYNYQAANIKNLPFNHYGMMFPEEDVDEGILFFKWIDFEFTCPDSLVAGSYYQMSRLWFGHSLRTPIGCDINWSLSHNDSGTLIVSQGGQYYESPGYRSRSISANFSFQDSMLAYGMEEDWTSIDEVAEFPSFQRSAFEMGQTSEGIFLPRTRSPLWMARTGIYGHALSPIIITQNAGGFYSTSLNMIEER